MTFNRQAGVHRKLQRGITPGNQTVQTSGGCRWVNAPFGREARDTVTCGTVVNGGINVAPTPLSMALCPSDKPFASARGPRAVVDAGGASLQKRVKGAGASASGAVLPLAREPRAPLTPVVLLSTGAPSTMPGPVPKALLSPNELLRLAGGPRGAAKAGGTSTSLAKRPTVVNASALLPLAERPRAGDNASSLLSSSTKSSRSGNAVNASK